METLRRSNSVLLAVLLFAPVVLLAAIPACAQAGAADQTNPPPATPETLSPGITVTGAAPGNEPPLPKLPPDQFTDCYETSKTAGPDTIDYIAMTLCESQLAQDRKAVIEKCINKGGKNAPDVVVQACTELLDRRVFIGSDRFYLYANRAEGYLAQGDRPHALQDYDAAVKAAPHNPKLYFNRAMFYLGQPDADAALQDFDQALSLDPKLVPALLQRAKLHKAQGNLAAALADDSEAVRLEPKTASIWSDRGYLCLLQQDYASAIKDEAEAIRLDPKLARAYFFRATAFQGLGEASKARADILTAVHLDPSLGRFVTNKDNKPLVTAPP
jgi:tetratricopeptide (TPR) repeat protein